MSYKRKSKKNVQKTAGSTVKFEFETEGNKMVAYPGFQMY